MNKWHRFINKLQSYSLLNRCENKLKDIYLDDENKLKEIYLRSK